MRFFLNRILKQIPIIRNLWKKYTEFIDAKYYSKNCTNYKIIPLGTYCLPRVITSLNRMKPKRFFGEKTTVFDMTFFKDFDMNADFIENHFETLFDNLVYDEERRVFQTPKKEVIFFHDTDKTIDELKEIYSRRINNFYEYVNDKSKFAYFLIATQAPFLKKQVVRLKNALEKYRSDNEFEIIIINQSSKKIKSFENVKIIDLTDDTNFEKINYKGTWALELEKQKTKYAKEFYRKLDSELSAIIKNER